MKRYLFLLLSLLAFSCDTGSDAGQGPHTLVGFWSRETVYLNGSNSNEYVDFLNEGSNYLEIRKDNTFSRAYEQGNWNLTGRTLILDRLESFGRSDWTYNIISVSPNQLVLETRLTEGQYCCDFDAFTDDQVIIIREEYKKLH